MWSELSTFNYCATLSCVVEAFAHENLFWIGHKFSEIHRRSKYLDDIISLQRLRVSKRDVESDQVCFQFSNNLILPLPLIGCSNYSTLNNTCINSLMSQMLFHYS